MTRLLLLALILSLSPLLAGELDDLAARLNADPASPDYTALATLARVAGNADLDQAMREQARAAIAAFRRAGCGKAAPEATTPSSAVRDAEPRFACSVEPKINGKREPECQPQPIEARGDTRKGCEAKARELCQKFCEKCGCARCGAVRFEKP